MKPLMKPNINCPSAGDKKHKSISFNVLRLNRFICLKKVILLKNGKMMNETKKINV